MLTDGGTDGQTDRQTDRRMLHHDSSSSGLIGPDELQTTDNIETETVTCTSNIIPAIIVKRKRNMKYNITPAINSKKRNMKYNIIPAINSKKNEI